jgi:hypothetical protein
MPRFHLMPKALLLVALCSLTGICSTPLRADDAPAGKLVVTQATYGDLPDGAKTDVTGKVADKVNDDSLSIDASNDNFGDPADGIVKKLTVDYTFDGKEKSKSVNEGETLTISDKGE